ncbi:hypothetical protein [Flyfo microvirus Tbat2_110]|nr:hypothetical protein [Flyfo microvirus Tbat2_110]
MKRMLSVLVAPLARRVGALLASATAGAAVVDPAIASRVEAWVMAGVLLAADLVATHLRAKSQEVR